EPFLRHVGGDVREERRAEVALAGVRQHGLPLEVVPGFLSKIAPIFTTVPFVGVAARQRTSMHTPTQYICSTRWTVGAVGGRSRGSIVSESEKSTLSGQFLGGMSQAVNAVMAMGHPLAQLMAARRSKPTCAAGAHARHARGHQSRQHHHQQQGGHGQGSDEKRKREQDEDGHGMM
ncbi:MAG: hypothetical protein ACPIOQ_59670, partial [Promethearchaeia archaeon]